MALLTAFISESLEISIELLCSSIQDVLPWHIPRPMTTIGNHPGMVASSAPVKFEARIRELVANHPDLAAIVEPLLIARRVLREQLGVLHRQLLEIVRHDEVCRRLITTPGVGPVVALTFRATVDVPSRFTSSKAVGAAFGLTPRRQQSGEIDRMGASRSAETP